jgi:hypothetical protein
MHGVIFLFDNNWLYQFRKDGRGDERAPFGMGCHDRSAADA